MNDLTRREALKLMAVGAASACVRPPQAEETKMDERPLKADVILARHTLGSQWPTPNPFLFCAHHEDRYPQGNGRYGPAASLAGRNMGQDFANKDGWNMYHGFDVPGFPQHPHRGFETVTVVRQGLLDHSDSLGAAARFGQGDVQWLTAGKGILHSEMFPLLEENRGNPVELFQVWLNLPRANKLVEPHFSMTWKSDIPTFVDTDAQGRKTTVDVIAGALGGVTPPPAPPKSWASVPGSDVAIWTVRMEPNAQWVMPAAPEGTNRTLYFFVGSALLVENERIGPRQGLELRAGVPISLQAGDDVVELFVLQGRPIEEPVAHYGPFVMNTRAELQQTLEEYQRTRFGGWPWSSEAPVHEREGRFARHADGRIERPA